jgi:hypothetical protein
MTEQTARELVEILDLIDETKAQSDVLILKSVIKRIILREVEQRFAEFRVTEGTKK